MSRQTGETVFHLLFGLRELVSKKIAEYLMQLLNFWKKQIIKKKLKEEAR